MCGLNLSNNKHKKNLESLKPCFIISISLTKIFTTCTVLFYHLQRKDLINIVVAWVRHNLRKIPLRKFFFSNASSFRCTAWQRKISHTHIQPAALLNGNPRLWQFWGICLNFNYTSFSEQLLISNLRYKTFHCFYRLFALSLTYTLKFFKLDHVRLWLCYLLWLKHMNSMELLFLTSFNIFSAILESEVLFYVIFWCLIWQFDFRSVNFQDGLREKSTTSHSIDLGKSFCLLILL